MKQEQQQIHTVYCYIMSVPGPPVRWEALGGKFVGRVDQLKRYYYLLGPPNNFCAHGGGVSDDMISKAHYNYSILASFHCASGENSSYNTTQKHAEQLLKYSGIDNSLCGGI